MLFLFLYVGGTTNQQSLRLTITATTRKASVLLKVVWYPLLHFIICMAKVHATSNHIQRAVNCITGVVLHLVVTAAPVIVLVGKVSRQPLIGEMVKRNLLCMI